MKLIYSLFFAILSLSLQAQTTLESYYKDYALKPTKVLSFFNNGQSTELGGRPTPKSQRDLDKYCYAYMDKKNNKFVNNDNCWKKIHLKSIPDNNLGKNTFVFTMEFTPIESALDSDAWLFKIALGKGEDHTDSFWNTWNDSLLLGIEGTGRVYIGYYEDHKFHKMMSVFNADRIHFNEKNTLKFIRFPNGYYYIQVNSFERWSFTLNLPRYHNIPTYGLKNSIAFRTSIDDISYALSYIENDGESTIFHDNNNLKWIGKMKNNKREGIWENYYENGKKYISSNFKDGKPDGLSVVLYEDGSTQARIHFQNGLLNGELIQYYQTPNDSIQFIENYKDNELHGLRTEYYENGGIKMKGKYENGNLVGEEEKYDENGNRI